MKAKKKNIAKSYKKKTVTYNYSLMLLYFTFLVVVAVFLIVVRCDDGAWCRVVCCLMICLQHILEEIELCVLCKLL